MTVPQPVPVQLSAGMAYCILDLLATSEALLSVLKARGDCVDSSAGPKLIPRGEQVPTHLPDDKGSSGLMFLQLL